jgi:hypothetical protein
MQNGHSVRLFIALGWLAGQSAGRCPVGRSLLRLPILILGVWLFHGVRAGRVPRRGVAGEGSALLVTALPVLAVQKSDVLRRRRQRWIG